MKIAIVLDVGIADLVTWERTGVPLDDIVFDAITEITEGDRVIDSKNLEGGLGSVRHVADWGEQAVANVAWDDGSIDVHPIAYLRVVTSGE